MLVYLFCAFLILSLLLLPQLNSTLFPYTTLFRSAPRGTRLRLDQDLGHVRVPGPLLDLGGRTDRKSTRLNSSHVAISYAVLCLKKKTKNDNISKAQKKVSGLYIYNHELHFIKTSA